MQARQKDQYTILTFKIEHKKDIEEQKQYAIKLLETHTDLLKAIHQPHSRNTVHILPEVKPTLDIVVLTDNSQNNQDNIQLYKQAVHNIIGDKVDINITQEPVIKSKDNKKNE